MIPKFKAALVKFDPINTNFFDKEGTFRDIASEFAETEDFLFAEIQIREEDDFPKLYNMDYKDYPALKLFNGTTDNPITYTGEWTKELILEWLKTNTNLRFTLPACLGKFDELAETFLNQKPEEKIKILQKAKNEASNLTGKAKISANIYIKIMQLVVERGNVFVTSEEARVKNLLTGKITEAKKKELQSRLNIIHSFYKPESTPAKEEL